MKTLTLPTTLLGLILTGQVFAAKTIPNHAIADLVLGQSDFVTSAPGSPPSPFTLNSPVSIVIDPVSRKVFVADSSNRRVLRYANASSLTNGAGAEAVFGQPKFSSTTSSGGDQGLARPAGMCLDRKGRLWVADSSNNRVLMFEAAVYRSSYPFADKVIGQPDFATTTPGTTASKLDDPYGVFVDTADRLWVSDDDNNRVLRFDSISSKPVQNATADGVLGQANFTTSVAGSGSSGLQGPIGIVVSASGTLYVACSNANRVMRFNNAATLGNGAGASAVLGQPDFSTTTPGLSSTTFDEPFGLHLTADDALWVSEYDNRRLVRFDAASTKPTGSAANGVIGQPNFTTNTALVTNRGIGGIFFQPFVDATSSLWVPDYENARVLRFSPDVTRPLLTLTGTVPKKTTKKSVVIQGTASDTYGISKVQYRIGTGALKTASGTTSWQFTAPLKKGKNKITIFATDAVGNVSLSKVVRIKRS